MRDTDELFAALGRSQFRSRFRLRGKEADYFQQRGLETILEHARQFIEQGAAQLHESGAGELLAEDLRQAQQSLGEITGAVTADELLGKIFGSFCIGK